MTYLELIEKLTDYTQQELRQEIVVYTKPTAKPIPISYLSYYTRQHCKESPTIHLFLETRH